jgi:hypothetical protein
VSSNRLIKAFINGLKEVNLYFIKIVRYKLLKKEVITFKEVLDKFKLNLKS